MGTENRIVDWARYGEPILLKCKVCGARYHTENINCIGARTIFKSELSCSHPISNLEPVREELPSSILAGHEVITLREMVIYWQEVANRDNQVERQRIATCELEQVILTIGAEKILKIITVYMKGLE